MAYTLLQAVNLAMKQVKFIGGDSEALTSLTDTARQPAVDEIVRLWNEVISDLYTRTGVAMPTISKATNVTLATGTRVINLPADFEQIIWPLRDTTTGNQIWAYPGGYEQMLSDQLQPGSYTGLPYNAAIATDSGLATADNLACLYLERAPTSAENGRTYICRYMRRVTLASVSDTFPCSDGAVNALVPAVAELYKRSRQGEFDTGYYNKAIALAASLMSRRQPRDSW
jgi:hypothetical protein